jgi:hypothetical protein
MESYYAGIKPSRLKNLHILSGPLYYTIQAQGNSIMRSQFIVHINHGGEAFTKFITELPKLGHDDAISYAVSIR